MIIAKETSRNTLTVRLDGRLDTITSPDLEQALTDLAGSPIWCWISQASATSPAPGCACCWLSTQKKMGGKGDMVGAMWTLWLWKCWRCPVLMDILTIE